MSHIVALSDMFLHCDEHGHCTLFSVNPTDTILQLEILISTPNVY